MSSEVSASAPGGWTVVKTATNHRDDAWVRLDIGGTVTFSKVAAELLGSAAHVTFASHLDKDLLGVIPSSESTPDSRKFSRATRSVHHVALWRKFKSGAGNLFMYVESAGTMLVFRRVESR